MWSFPSWGWLHVCAEQCPCLQINRPRSHLCAVHRVAWAGLTFYCTSQIFRSPAFPLLEVFLCLFSLLGVSGEVNFKSCLNCADMLAETLPWLIVQPDPPAVLPVSTAHGSVQSCPWQREGQCTHRVTGLSAADVTSMRDAKINATIQSAARVNQAGSKQLLLWKPSGLDRRALERGKGHLPRAKWQTVSVPPAPKSALRRCPSSGTRGLLIACMWLRAVLCSGTAHPSPKCPCYPSLTSLG